MDEILTIAADLQVADMPGSMQPVAERCGIPDAVMLMVRVPGIPLYIPDGRRQMIRNHIRTHFDGSNSLSLAVKLGIDSSKVIEIHKSMAGDQTPEKNPMNEYMMRVAEACGNDIAMRLMQHFPKTVLYVPHGGLVLLQKAYIRRHFDGINTVRLAIQLRVSEMFVRKVIAAMYQGSRARKKNPIDAIRAIASRQGFISEAQLRDLALPDSDMDSLKSAIAREKILLQSCLL